MDIMAQPCFETGDISRARMLPVTTDDTKNDKRPFVPLRDVSEPFHHDNLRYHGRRIVLHTINGRQVKFKYPHPPTEDEQAELLKLPAIACSCCLPREMQRGECHAVWLVDKLRKKFQWPHAPELISAAIPPDMITQAKMDCNWKHARAIHRHAFVARRAVHVSHRRGGNLVPRLIEGITIGNSRFGNPFASLPVAQSRALFEHYVDANFQELSDATVQAIVSQVDSAVPTGR